MKKSVFVSGAHDGTGFAIAERMFVSFDIYRKKQRKYL